MGCWQEKLEGARSAIPKDLDFIPGQWGTVEVSLGRRMASDVCFGKLAHLLGRLDEGVPGGWRLLRKSR